MANRYKLITSRDLAVTSGASVANSNTGDQTLGSLGAVPTTRSLTINGTAQDLSADRSWTVSASFGGIPNTYAANFSLAAASGWPIVGYITMQSNTYVTIPSGSTLLMIN